jgi:hypothetical protein
MSDEAYARSTARETRIWRPFVYSFPFTDEQTADRITIFGLYANSYLNGHKYLQELEDEDLANLLADYNAKIADLTAQQQMVVADIVSKRYLASIDKIIHDGKMATKQAEIDADSDIMDARIAALSADRAALDTMAAKVAAETTKTQAKITELEAYIALEGIHLSEVDIEIAQKELQSAKLDNEKLNAQNEILRLQVATLETAMELIEIDLKIARTAVDIAETERAIARIGLLADDLTIAQAHTLVEEAGIPISAARILLAQAKYDDAEAEKTYIQETLMEQAALALEKQKELEAMKQTIRLNELGHKEDANTLTNDLKEDAADIAIDIAHDNNTFQGIIDAQEVLQIKQRESLNWLKTQASINAANISAAAEIASQLTHTIQKAA